MSKNFDKIIEDLNKQDKFLNASLTSMKSPFKTEETKILSQLGKDKANMDPDMILNQNLQST